MKKIKPRIFQTIFVELITGVGVFVSTPVLGQLKSVTPVREVQGINQIEYFARSAQDLLVQSPVQSTPTQTPPQTRVVPVTQVKLVPTKNGIQVILTTPIQAQEEILTVPAFGNESLIWIKNTRLQLPSAQEFHIQNPQPGIRDVYVTQQDDVTVQVRIVGDKIAPIAKVVQQNGRIFVDLRPATSTAQLPKRQQGSRLNGENRSTAQLEQTNPQQKPTPSSPSNLEPIEIVVTGTPYTGYNVPDASIGTRTNTPKRDVPQVINVIPQEVIKDQHDIFLGDALKNVGVSQSFFPSSLTDAFSIRGFVARDVLTDGLRNYFNQTNQTNTNNVERIEVLRGPASVLYGQGDLGGIINLVTKQPLREPYYAANFSVGSFNSIQPSFDIGGPLTSDKKLLYRLDGSYLSTDSFIDFYHQTRSQIAGALSWEIEKNTKLTLNASYDDNYINLNPHGLPAVGTVLPNPNGQLPRSRYLGEPGSEDPYDTAITRLSYKLEHRFNENWSVENAFQAILTQENYKALFFPTRLEPDNRTLDRTEYAFHSPNFMNGYDINTQVTGRFNTASLKHQLIIGLEYAWQNVHTSFNAFSAPSIDIFNPVYGQPGGSTVLNRYQGGNRVDDLGLYAQDIITLFSNLKLVLGGRYDWAGETDFNQFPNPTSTSQSWSAFSPRAGLVYQPIKPISLYASYTYSFYPQTGISESGQPFQPQHGTQYEVGVKAEMLDDKLTANLALYQLTESNIATTDPNNPNFSILVGEERSRGVELFITGEILPSWNLIASYAYTDPLVTKDNDIPVGKLIALAPQNQASLWTTYIIPKGKLKGIGAGFGLFYLGDRQGDDLNTYKLPSYVRTDAALYYRRGKFDAALNFQNLFDLKYFDTTNRNTQVFYGNPFTVTFTLGWHF